MDELSHIERSFIVNASELDILAGTLGDLDEAERQLPPERLAEILLGLIDRGWLDVRRYVARDTPDGMNGLGPGEVIDRAELPDLLTDPTTWDYAHPSPSWIGALILTFTEPGLKVWRGQS